MRICGRANVLQPSAGLSKAAVAGRAMPHDAWPDSTVRLALDGYRFIGNRRRALDTDIFACRLLLRRTVCVGGPGAAEFFYDTALFRRRGVAPRRILKTLLGEGGIHGLDGAEHRSRKAMFLSFMGPQAVDGIRDLMQRHWSAGVAGWKGQPVPVFERSQLILFQALAEFAGIPLARGDAPARAADLAAMVDAFGGLGPRYWKGRLARVRSETWMQGMIRGVRDGDIEARSGTALAVIARYRQADGSLLDDATAAVELLNVIRPIMAAAYFIEFAALMLGRNPQLRDEIAGDDVSREHFINEVRRLCPFTPFLGAETCRDVDFDGFVIPAGTLTVLDVYGIHHDDRIWPNAERFDHTRFRNRGDDTYTLIPQGGGEHRSGHRCAGEWLTMEALHAATRALARSSYGAAGDGEFDLARIPSRLKRPLVLEVA